MHTPKVTIYAKLETRKMHFPKSDYDGVYIWPQSRPWWGRDSEASGTYPLILTQVISGSHMPPMYLQRNRGCCLRYYSDIWEHNADGSRNIAGLYLRHACEVELVSTLQACRRSRPAMASVAGRLVFSYRNSIVGSTCRRVGVLSQCRR